MSPRDEAKPVDLMAALQESLGLSEAHPEPWTEVSAAWDGKVEYPPGATGNDPRNPECQHAWPPGWAKTKGERQRRCRHCRRWIWDTAWLVYVPPAGEEAQ